MTSAHTSTRTPKGGMSLQTLRTPLIVAGVVLCFGVLSLYGYLVQSQVKRGETFREAQRAGIYGVRDGSLSSTDLEPSAQNGPLLASASPR